MNQEQLQALISSFTLPGNGAFDSAALFDQLTEATAPLADFSTLEYRQQLFNGVTDGLDQFAGALPAEARNFSDAPGFVETYSVSNTTTTTANSAIILRTVTQTTTTNDGVLLGEGTPLETNAFHDSVSTNSTTTNRLNGSTIASSESQTDTFGIENQLVNLTLQNNESSGNATILGQAIQTASNTTTLSLDLADMQILDVGLSNVSLNSTGVELLTLSYPNAEGAQDSLVLPTSTNVLLPLALGAAEGFANNPDPTALLDTLTGLAQLPEPIGAFGGDNPLAGLGLPALPA
ncbi:hypothetical protein EV673_0271 [Limnobacter thiooxidans]|uniref:Uncharacterized protein n=1 Tax=Limnobacter thiooxidans TaxID=131080 RepID=A0AA86J080_9BURK|nr:hypothetical protein EV673_0271 [Limnobacter thiooxidans]BET26613.1 hypothetical protein RGQ30_21140 [Limnobacter thiooxidans]